MRKIVTPLLIAILCLAGCSEEQPPFDDAGRIRIHTELQHAYLQDKIDSIHEYAIGEQELSRPADAVFSWEGEQKEYKVLLSENPDFNNPKTYSVTTNSVSFQNLKIDTNYYYRVSSDDIVIKEDHFQISHENIRNLYISGVTNARDLGGYYVDGGRLRQGLIFRTARLNHNSVTTPSNLITAKGIDTMVNDLKVKSEIDLRMVSNNEVGGLIEGTGVLGETVKYYQCPMDWTQSYDSEINTQAVKKIFAILGDKDNFPTFFHCSIGTDRTGYIAWLINACLGLNEYDLYRDYLFSNFGNIGSRRSRSTIDNKYVNTIHNYRGETLKEKTINYLLDTQIKINEINTLTEMMLIK